MTNVSSLPPRRNINTLIGWITYNNASVPLGTMRDDYYVKNIHLHVTEAFDDSGTDNITVGRTGDTDAFMAAEAVNTTGVKSITLGSSNGYNSTNYEVNVYYAGQNGDATQGKAIVIVELEKVPPQP